MNKLKEKSGAATPQLTRIDDKKSVNIRVNPLINFQIGLIAALVAAFLIMELSTAKPIQETTKMVTVAKLEDQGFTGEFTPVPNEKIKPVVKQKTTPKIELVKTDPNKAPVVVKNDTPDIPDNKMEPVSTTTTTTTTTTLASSETEVSKSIDGNGNKPIKSQPLITVHEVPLFPGCDVSMSREQRVKCLNEKMARFVQRKFDTSLGRSLNSKDVVKIAVVFTIGTDGLPRDIQVKAPNKDLEEEALKVISNLPQMTPGKIDNMPVNVTYSLPIRFQVHD